MNTLGETIRLFRLQKRWSQENMAHELGMSLAGYSKIERNLTDLSLSRLYQIAALCGVKPSKLLSLSEDDKDPPTIIQK